MLPAWYWFYSFSSSAHARKAEQMAGAGAQARASASLHVSLSRPVVLSCLRCCCCYLVGTWVERRRGLLEGFLNQSYLPSYPDLDFRPPLAAHEHLDIKPLKRAKLARARVSV